MGSAQPAELQQAAESGILHSDFRSDLVPKKPGRNGQLVRIARGLYRYGPTGTIYLCRKQRGKNVWRSLQTKDRTRAMAISSILDYVSAQNGNHEVFVVPDNFPVETN